MTDELPDDAPALGEALRAAVGRFVRATKAQADAMPASRTETLGHLRRTGPQTMAELAAARGVSHQTVSRMVGELEQLGLVTRGAHPTDARGFLIALSPAGEAALDAELRSRAQHIGSAIDTALSPRDRQALGRLPGILDRLTQQLSRDR